MKAHFIRTAIGFIPAEADAEKILKKVALGEIVSLEMKIARNYLFHKKFMSMIRAVFENQDRYQDFEQLLIEIKLKTGHYQEHITTKGRIIYVPKSLSFDSMDEIEFQQFYDLAVQKVIDSGLASAETMEYIARHY